MTKDAQAEFKKLSKQFAKIAANEKAIKKEKADMAELMKKTLKGLGVDKVETQEGTFTIYKTRAWTFSPKVGELEKKLETLMVEEKENGVATCTESDSMRFTAAKADAE